MVEAILCRICGKRRAKRACPAVSGDICPLCCGEQREVTLFCPLECPFLREAHRREKPVEVAPTDIAGAELEITEEFIQSHEEMLLFCIAALLQAATRLPEVVDSDILACLEALIRTQRTADSGLIYETKATQRIAAELQRSFSDLIKDYEAEWQKRELLVANREGDMGKVLVFLYRVGQQSHNGRPKGRMYMDALRSMLPDVRVDERAPSIIL